MIQKLKILPPTLRDKKRYIAFEVTSKGRLCRDDIISMLLDGSLYLFGAYGTANFELWLVKLWRCTDKNNPETSNEHRMKGILRCRRGEEDSLKAVIPTITNFRGKPVVFHTLGISGTIKSAIKNFIKL
jgi:ribonuclease P/MRP protein subunit POP5